MLITPSMEEVKLIGSKIGLPDIECEKFFHYNEARGWIVGRRKMVSIAGAMSYWKLNWLERQTNNQQVATSSFRNNQTVRPVKDWRDRILDNVAKELEGDQP